MNKLIGNTPLIKINYKYKNCENYIYAKLEYYNLTGSIKDRVIYHILNKAMKNNKFSANTTFVGATSGNTGISLSAIGSFLKHNVKIYMPDWVSKERLDLMNLYGADVVLVSKEDGGFLKCIEMAKQYASENNGYLIDQFNNMDNIEAHYLTTSNEIINKITVDAFVTGIGTGGTLMGVAKKLKEVNNNVNIFAVEPENMSLIKNKTIGNHKIEGIGDEFIPNIVDLNMIDDVILVRDSEAINMCKKLSKELGLGVGISSGANMIAAIKLKELGFCNVVTIFADDSKKYLSTDLVKNNFDCLEDIELLNYTTL